MDGRYRDGAVVVGGDARQQFHDARGYGRPADGGLALAPVEAAHLLYRGDLDAVLVGREETVDRLGFRAFLAAGAPGFAARFLVYKDLRDRGFYLSPAEPPRTDLAVDGSPTCPPGRGLGRPAAGARGDEAAPDSGVAPAPGYDFVVYPRGKGPWDDEVRYRVRAIGERADVPAAALGDTVLAVVDEESEITYLETDRLDPAGEVEYDPAAVEGQLLGDGVIAWDPPPALHEEGFYGQPLDARDDEDAGALQLSLVEAAYLAAGGALSLMPFGDGAGSGTPKESQAAGAGDAAAGSGDGAVAVVERGRAVEGERFDRRLRAYRALRDAGLVPKTGFKFGADFRVYREFDGVDELGHSEYLVRVLDPDHVFAPRDLALDVRLAGGVRKRMVFARAVDDEIEWIVVERLTP